MRYLQPMSIQKGDLVGIVAPAGPIEREIVEQAVIQLESDGFRVRLGTYVYGQRGVFSGSDSERLQDLQNMVDDKEVKVILCTRGGYGSARIVNQVRWESLVYNPKWIIGFSDITVIHAKLHRLGMKSVHGTMLKGFFQEGGELSENYFELIELLLGQKLNYNWANSWSQNGTCTGQLIGGNLAMLQSLRGTPLDNSFQNKILFLEEIGEHYYQIDRMLLNLYQGGVFNQIAGLVIGQFSGCKNGKYHYDETLEEIILRYTKPSGIPVAFGMASGHEERNSPLLFGHVHQLEVYEGNIQFKMLPQG